MSKKASSVTIIWLLFIPGLIRAAEVQLTWKLKEGDSFYVERVESIKQSADLITKPVTQESEVISVVHFRVIKANADAITMEQKLAGTKLKGDLANSPTLAKALERLKSTPLQVTITPEGKVTKLDGYEEAIKKLGEGKPENAAAMKAIFSEESIKAALIDIFGFLPDKPVSKGAKWTKEIKTPLGPFGFLQGNYEFVLKGKDDKSGDRNQGTEQIGAGAKLHFDYPKNGIAMGDLHVVRAEFKTENTSGTIWFDATIGRLVRSERDLDVKGTLTLDNKGTGLTVNLEIKTNTKMRLLDKNPLE